MIETAIENSPQNCNPDVTTDNLHSPFVMPVDWSDYMTSCEKYEKLSDASLKLRNFDTAVLGGHGVTLKVRYDALCIEYQRATGNSKVLKLSRGVHKTKQVVLFARGGYITLDAIEWFCQQNITVYLMNYNGELLQVLTPKQPRNSKLNFFQFLATIPECVNSPSLSIAIELIRRKTLSQVATLTKHPELPYQFEAIEALENGLHRLHKIDTIEGLRQLEGMLAMAYFKCFSDMPIKWEKQASKIVPEHWKKISPRNSPLSYDGSGRRAVNPYHAALNFALALLKAQILEAITIAGLSPDVGYLHSYEGENKPSLVFDLMEPFRAIVDDMVLSFFQKTTFKKGDFIQSFSGEARMNEELRRYILASCRVNFIEVDRLCRWLRSTLEDWGGKN